MSNMERDLSIIQKIAKAGKIFSKIVWIFCLVGIIGSVIGAISLALGVDQVLELGDVTIYGIIENSEGLSLGAMYTSLGAAIITCLGEMIPALFAERYFKHELAAGTPFTYEGAKEMKRLGILTIVLPLAATVLAEIVVQILEYSMGFVTDLNISTSVSVGLGLGLLVMSVIFRYGAGLEGKETSEECHI